MAEEEDNEEEQDGQNNYEVNQEVEEDQVATRQEMNANLYLESEDNPQQLISDIDPRLESNIYNLGLKAMLLDQQPIRTACFSPNGNFIALGTNSKSLKICALPHLALDDDEEE